jgi:hypothetical protein
LEKVLEEIRNELREMNMTLTNMESRSVELHTELKKISLSCEELNWAEENSFAAKLLKSLEEMQKSAFQMQKLKE